jgi:hypothetical protein
LYSVSPEATFEIYPWLGKTNALNVVKTVKSKNIRVYNLWVDGDNTYIVNGYGTTSIIGDGGWLRKIYELNLATVEDVLNLMNRLATSSNNLRLGSYVMNNLYIDNRDFNAVIAKLFFSKNKSIKTLIDGLYTAIGFMTRICKYGHFKNTK